MLSIQLLIEVLIMINIRKSGAFANWRLKHASSDYTPLTMYERMSLELRSARFEWQNARYMLVLSNRGRVSKSQAFTVYNKAVAKYKRTIKLVAATLAMPKGYDTGTEVT